MYLVSRVSFILCIVYLVCEDEEEGVSVRGVGGVGMITRNLYLNYGELYIYIYMDK